MDGVTLVGLDLLVGLAFALGRRHDDALESEAEETPGEDETGGPGLVADFQVTECDPELLGEAPQAAFRGQHAAAAFAEVGGLLAFAGLGVGDGDGILVHVESDVVRCLQGVVVDPWFTPCRGRIHSVRLR